MAIMMNRATPVGVNAMQPRLQAGAMLGGKMTPPNAQPGMYQPQQMQTMAPQQMQAMTVQAQPAQGAPQVGVAGAEQALRSGLGGALGILESSGDMSALQSFVSPGQQANQQQAALSGALGQQAQQQAFQQFTESPGQAYLRERGEQAVLRNAAATGGLGGGRVLQELQRQGMGMAAQDLDAQFNRLGQVSSAGLQAAGQRDAAQQQAAMEAARMTYGTGEALAGGRTRAGEQIAGNIGQTSAGLQQLLAQQGAGLADITGQGAGNLAGLLTAYAQAQSTGQSDLAALLANIATGSASQRVGLPALPGMQQTQGMAGGIGSLLGGISTAWNAFSDVRLKQNISKVGEVRGVNLYTWDWKPWALDIVGDQPGFGVIAQELAEVKPEAVSVGDDGFLRVDYSQVFGWH